ncbi:hypothetical protein UY3_01728 [Chelonia mydas]|uniref:Uncharacterized protein n=1 Tax=Chelonia mydas TaxID=8469 RepID=M7BV08_CHEMY|nr:hypothetical protein UY3_01728 [Chelonia mydas]
MAATLKPVIMQGTAFSSMEWKSINCMKKLVQMQTDIIFLSKCKQMDIVPKGLKMGPGSGGELLAVLQFYGSAIYPSHGTKIVVEN